MFYIENIIPKGIKIQACSEDQITLTADYCYFKDIPGVNTV